MRSSGTSPARHWEITTRNRIDAAWLADPHPPSNHSPHREDHDKVRQTSHLPSIFAWSQAGGCLRSLGMDTARPSVRVTDAARRHDIEDEDILHVYRYAMLKNLSCEELIVVTGPRRDGNFLEVGFRYGPDSGSDFIVHAMPVRPKFLRPS